MRPLTSWQNEDGLPKSLITDLAHAVWLDLTSERSRKDFDVGAALSIAIFSKTQRAFAENPELFSPPIVFAD